MLSSIPTLTPRDAHSLWYTPSSTFTLSTTSHPLAHSPPSPTSQNVHPNGHHTRASRTRNTVITPLQQLALDEQSVAQRKLNIARFGATWLRPPGIQKTLQGELDEKAEREEAEAQILSEVGNEDAEIEVIQQILADGEEFAGEDDGEQDLDADIPEAEVFEDEDGDLDEEDEDGDEEEEDEEDEEEDEDEVDLDDDVPEADAETIWDTESEDSENNTPSEGEDPGENLFDQEEPQMPPPGGTRGYDSQGTDSLGGTDSSPQYAMFSHDEHFGPQDGEEMDARLRAYQRSGARGASRGREMLGRSDDEMEVDSDGH